MAGVFFVPFEHQADREAANRRITERLRQAGIPVVLLDRDIESFPNRSAYDLVGIDNFAGGYQLAEHLIKLGARRLGYVMRPLTASTVDARIAGARIAMLAHGLEAPKAFVHSGDPTDLKFVRSFAQAHQLDAILCTSDHLAAQLLQSLTRLGIRVPQDLRLVGFDDVRFASLLTIPLTTMEQPCRDIAITAFNALRERLKNPTLPPRTLMLTPASWCGKLAGPTCSPRRRWSPGAIPSQRAARIERARHRHNSCRTDGNCQNPAFLQDAKSRANSNNSCSFRSDTAQQVMPACGSSGSGCNPGAAGRRRGRRFPRPAR